jgi:hypothetical protein
MRVLLKGLPDLLRQCSGFNPLKGPYSRHSALYGMRRPPGHLDTQGTDINTRIHAPVVWHVRRAHGRSATHARFGHESRPQAPFSSAIKGLGVGLERRIVRKIDARGRCAR